MRVVVSLTTIPGRRPWLERALASIRAQTRQPDAIYLWLPQERFGAGLDDYRFPGVSVNLGPDQGPAMKLLPVLSIETDPETCVIPLDDDVEYPPALIERLTHAAWLHPDRAIGFTGWILDPAGTGTGVIHLNESVPASAMFQPVHVLEGYRGVLYRRRFLDLDIFEHLGALDAFRFHDDILLSGYLASRGIPRLARWYGAETHGASDHWTLNGEHIGLHTTPGWLERGRACVDYWLEHSPGALEPIDPFGPGERLQLCAASEPRAGFTHHAHPGTSPMADIQHDLRERPWPWPDGRFSEILMLDPADGQAGFDTLPPPQEWLDECLRILKPGGHLKRRLATGPISIPNVQPQGEGGIQGLSGAAWRAMLEAEQGGTLMTLHKAPD